ncbi:MAG: hypothetical protein U0L84_05965 [Acutalibacteraceae bacterium]|nr:hypothetical protein [Acutalibacteraceae bacterium]
MKKFISIILLPIFIMCIGCKAESKNFYQEMTIARLPSPPKCKITRNVSDINKVCNLFIQTPKSPLDDKINGWIYKVDIDIDGQVFSYAVGHEFFTDSDGTQYAVDGEKLMSDLESIYNEIVAIETDYPKNEKNT